MDTVADRTVVNSTRITVAAIFEGSRTLTVVAFVVLGAPIFVVTGGGNRRVCTPFSGIATILRTNVVVVASHVGTGTHSRGTTFVVLSADVFIIARYRLGYEHTTHRWITGVGRTKVVVGAHFLDTGADPLITKVVSGTFVVVITWYLNGFVLTALCRIAIIQGARVAVITQHGLPAALSAVA